MDRHGSVGSGAGMMQVADLCLHLDHRLLLLVLLMLSLRAFAMLHGLPSLNASSSDGPIRPLPKAAPASAPEVLDLTHDLAPAMVGPEGSRLSDINSGKGLSLMGWHVPLDVKQWWPLFQDELDIFCRPFRGIKAYSDSRPPWFTRFNLRQDLKKRTGSLAWKNTLSISSSTMCCARSA